MEVAGWGVALLFAVLWLNAERQCARWRKLADDAIDHARALLEVNRIAMAGLQRAADAVADVRHRVSTEVT